MAHVAYHGIHGTPGTEGTPQYPWHTMAGCLACSMGTPTAGKPGFGITVCCAAVPAIICRELGAGWEGGCSWELWEAHVGVVWGHRTYGHAQAARTSMLLPKHREPREGTQGVPAASGLTGKWAMSGPV